MKKSLLLLSALLAFGGMGASAANDYGLPADIQSGNILHCFDWPASAVKAELPNIAAAGFGSVQLSPLQRGDVNASGTSWHDLYRPYDLAFKPSSFCSEADLKALCSEADKYGIKVIVDVVANHVDKTAGYHDTWWDSNGRVRWEGSCQYSNRYSITHGQLGDYGDINSESSEVQARAKSYVEFLKSCGVDGIRWDAAKHIATPSEGCGFWSTVTSVSGLWHYGEILNDDGTPINDYAKYMSVTDNEYSNNAAKNNQGIQSGYGGRWAVDRGVASNKLVYWAESHDTYSNDEWSQNVDQATIDRAYACIATRNGATALYFIRPNSKGFNNIKTGKSSSTAYKSAAITAVNKLRNAAGSAADYCTSTGNAFSCTRQGIGAVVVMKGSGNISIANGGGYCPAGSYKDLVSGGTFTVTASNISGNVGSSGIAVIIKDGVTPTPNPTPDPTPGPTPTGSMWILGNLSGAAGWSTTPGTGVAMTQNGTTYTASNVEFVLASGETKCYFNLTDYVGSSWDDLNMSANRYGAATEGAPITLGTAATVVKYANNVDASGCLSWTVAPGKYDVKFDASAMTVTLTNVGDTPNPTPDPTPTPSGDYNVYYDNASTNWATPYIHHWPASSSTWPGVAMTKVDGNIWGYKVPDGTTGILFNAGDGDASKTKDMDYVANHKYNKDGDQGEYNNPNPNPGPTPGPTPTGSMWILGNLSGAAGWSTTPGTGVAMTQNGTTYTASNVEFVLASGETKCYFNLTDYVGSSWDDLNMSANRYGAATEGAPITLGTAATVVKYANNVDASGCLSWTVAPGKYDVKFDASAMTVTLTNVGDTPNPTPDPTPTPSGDYNVYYDNASTNWATPYIHHWPASSSTWPGVAMTKVDGNIWGYKVPDGTTGILFNAGDGDASKTKDMDYVANHKYNKDGDQGEYNNNNPIPDPTPGTSLTIYFDNSNTSWSSVNCYSFANSAANDGQWPGKAMTVENGNIFKAVVPAGSSVVFNCGDSQTVDVAGVQDKHLYKGLSATEANGDGKQCNKVEDAGVYGDNPTPTKPVVTASPASGTSFTDKLSVTLTVSPAATIYYTIDGSTPSTSSYTYSAAINLTETATIKTLAVTSEGAQNTQSFSYTKGTNPVPDPVISGNNLITDYYKVNPNGKVGTNKTINMSFNGMKSTTALSNWTDAELIAQGVARDVAQAMKGVHERPIIDSYAIYAAYDNDNLYLGAQFVYFVWDIGGEGKQPGESKPYNMDGRLMWAFDLDPNSSFDGYINGTKAIWNDEGAPGAKFNNGVDAVWIGSTKPGVGTPGFFVPTPDGHASYDAAYCKSISGSYYGYADGVLPSIDKLWGQNSFGFDPEVLEGNAGFVDLSGEIDKSAHTFYEWKFPLSVLGVTADYIKNHGIGVMFLDVYGSSPVGGTPYDAAYFDNVKGSYSADPSSSQEKEDEDVITYAPARIGKLLVQTGIEDVVDNAADDMKIYASDGKLYIVAPEATDVIITTVSGMSQRVAVQAGMNVIDDLARGFYVVNNTKVVL
ncbi:MAG: starch-binding protein [Pseudoflavonifractor sp.]|nr:starch-binding protein [Pseudoflavonifractor sp.]